jgi:pyruvate, orthophosphate dikinase
LTVATRFVYEFDEGTREMRELLGGKGANLAKMTRVLGAERVPAGFVITTEACVAYMGPGELPEELKAQVGEALGRLEERTGKRLGDPFRVPIARVAAAQAAIENPAVAGLS